MYLRQTLFKTLYNQTIISFGMEGFGGRREKGRERGERREEGRERRERRGRGGGRGREEWEEVGRIL